MKIAIFSDTYPPLINGVAHVASSTARALQKLGHEVRVFCANDVPSIPLFGYPGERIALPIGVSYRRALAFKPDIIHSHVPFMVGWEAVALAWKHKIPLVGTHHTFFDHYLEHAHIDFALTRYLSWKYTVGYYNRCDLILSTSEALLKGMKEHGLKKDCVVFPNAVDTDFFQPASAEEKSRLKEHFKISKTSLIYMGRVSYEKGIDKVISAFRIIYDAKPEIQLMIVGDGPEKEKLENQSRNLGLEKSIIFTGALRDNDLKEALQASDIFITASKSENMPISVMEAMAAGLPCVGVDSLGMPEVIRDGRTGFIVPADDIEAMAEKALELIDDPTIRSRFADESRIISMQYGELDNARKLEGIYQSLIKNYVK